MSEGSDKKPETEKSEYRNDPTKYLIRIYFFISLIIFIYRFFITYSYDRFLDRFMISLKDGVYWGGDLIKYLFNLIF